MKKLLALTLILSTSLIANIQAESSSNLELDFDNDLTCLALNLYHEARSERTAGMWAVGDVTINRVKSISFPNTICNVVKQGRMYESWKTKRYPDLSEEERIYYPVKGKCQFSWWCDGKSDVPEELDSWYRALDIARLMIDSDIGLGLTDGADHYHADYIDPDWNDHMILITTIGNHKFYKSIR
tara:strand:- start:229 stop:780 length:552 start_codon:yes stop_codon:yes gene_type:complete